jgi:hypothetical protein
MRSNGSGRLGFGRGFTRMNADRNKIRADLEKQLLSFFSLLDLNCGPPRKPAANTSMVVQ